MDTLLNVSEAECLIGKDSIAYLYDLWKEMASILKLGNQLFMCGQTPIIYSIGSGVYRNLNVVFPKGHSTCWLVLDSLSANDIAHLQQNKGYGNWSTQLKLASGSYQLFLIVQEGLPVSFSTD